MSDDPSRPSLEERLAKLRARMEDGLPTRAAELRAAADRLASGDSRAREDIRRAAHRLRGTAGSHGHDALSTEAGEVELLASRDDDCARVVARTLALVASIRRIANESRPVAPVAAPPLVTPSARPLVGRSVLALDDDAPTRRLLELTLVTMGGADARVIEAPDEALVLLDHRAFDVIIVDAMMPTLTGLELVAAARHRAHGANGVFAFLSAATPEELGWTIPPGASWLRKPFRPRELLDALVRIVGGAAR
ncbi:response regulator [Sandaracinus amylolyticus]|uniref:response regulator n=1 Tax=Sandaracinus amylolyticus TaxID=927083 RepID=UPI00147034BC|nr:response regulator [Sandaracinus amylolyticus]